MEENTGVGYYGTTTPTVCLKYEILQGGKYYTIEKVYMTITMF